MANRRRLADNRLQLLADLRSTDVPAYRRPAGFFWAGGGGFKDSPAPALPSPEFSELKEVKFMQSEISSSNFWYTNFLSPGPLPNIFTRRPHEEGDTVVGVQGRWADGLRGTDRRGGWGGGQG